jgi:hypothetical protein
VTAYQLTPPCPPCNEEMGRWLDTTPQGLFPGLGYVTQASAAYDFTVAGMRDRHRIRYERWRDTVRFQRALIARTCREAGHVTAPSVPKVVQLDLFGEAA